MECDKVTHGRITMSHLCPSSQGDTWNFLDVQVIHCYNGGVTWTVTRSYRCSSSQGDTWNFSKYVLVINFFYHQKQ